MYNKKDNNKTLTNLGILFLRICAGGAMLVHGIPKLQTLLQGGEIKFFDFLGLGPTLSLVLTVFAEVVCAVLLIIGVVTRWASIPLIITMLVAAFMVHLNDPYSTKEMSLLYLVLFIFFLIVGGGKFSIDGLLKKEKR